jgi:hypothetical protein
VVMTFPAEGISLSFFFGVVGWCHSIVFLCAVQKCWTMFHPHWRSVTESFHHQPCNGRAHLNSPHSCMMVG